MPNRKHLILVVAGDSDDRGSLFGAIEGEGRLVATRAEGMEAAKYVAQARPQAVVADWDLSDMEGLVLLDVIKRVSPETQVLLMKFDPRWPEHEEVIRRGGADLLTKPIGRLELLQAVDRALLEEAVPR